MTARFQFSLLNDSIDDVNATRFSNRNNSFTVGNYCWIWNRAVTFPLPDSIWLLRAPYGNALRSNKVIKVLGNNEEIAWALMSYVKRDTFSLTCYIFIGFCCNYITMEFSKQKLRSESLSDRKLEGGSLIICCWMSVLLMCYQSCNCAISLVSVLSAEYEKRIIMVTQAWIKKG